MSAIDLAKEVLRTLIGDRIRTLVGDDRLGSAVTEALAKATDHAERIVDVEARKIIDQLGLALAVRDLADDATEVPAAFKHGPGESFGGLPAEEMPADWHPEPPKDDEKP